MKEFMTFGAVNSFYGNLSNVEKTEISKLFGIINFELFGKWVNALIDLRNICAHHDRLFNHRFQKQPERYRAAGVPSAAQNTLKGLLECLEYLLRARGFAVPVVADIDAVIRSCPSVRPGEAGF